MGKPENVINKAKLTEGTHNQQYDNANTKVPHTGQGNVLNMAEHAVGMAS